MCERVTVLDAFYTIKRPTMMCLEEEEKKEEEEKQNKTKKDHIK